MSPLGKLRRYRSGMLLENTHKVTVMLKIPPNTSLSIEITEKLAYLPDLK